MPLGKNEIRALEARFDACADGHPLLERRRSEAMTLFTAVADMKLVMAYVQGMDPQRLHAFGDGLINSLRHGYAWIQRGTEPGGVGAPEYSKIQLDEAKSLIDLADDYDLCWVIFPMAYRGLASLEQAEGVLTATHSWAEQPEYEAYNRLASVRPPAEDPTALVFEFFDRVVTVAQGGGAIAHVVKDRGLLRAGLAAMEATLAGAFEVPDEWAFTSYTIGEFRRVAVALRTIAYAMLVARATRFVDGDRTSVAPVTFARAELSRLLAELVDVERSRVKSILRTMTFGALPGLREIDPALQPIVEAGGGRLLLPLAYHAHSSPERNHLVLLNRIENERDIYSRLVQGKESSLFDDLVAALPDGMHAARADPTSTRPEADLIVWSTAERRAFAVELKWFIRPAEIREVVERDEELAKGVKQARNLAEALRSDEAWRQELWGSTSDEWVVEPLVISKNWIGYAHVQADDVPIVTEDHFLAKLRDCGSLSEVSSWLRDRGYLPVRDEDFRVVETETVLLDTRISWYGIDPIHRGEFRPV